MTLKGKIYLVALLSLVLLVIINEINLSYLHGGFPYKDGLITTADEYSYFAPADNFLEHFRWAESPDGREAFVRTPGYGLIYLLARLIGGGHAFLVLKIIQTLLFTGSILLLSKILQFFKVRNNLILLFAAIYGLMPCFSGFVYYTLSESVIPFFVTWSLYCVLDASRKREFSWATVFSLSLLTLIRPQLVVLPLFFLLLFLLKDQRKTALAVLISFLPLSLWQIRTYSIEGEITNFHPIYSVSNNSLYRPPHEAMTNLFRIWDYRGDVFHGNMALLSRDTLTTTREEVLRTIPVKFHVALDPVLKKFQEFRLIQREQFSGKIVSDYFPGERELVQQINRTRSDLIVKFPIDHYLGTPVKSAKKLIGTSMMNLNVYQDAWRNTLLVVLLKFLSFGLIMTGMLAMLYIILFQPTYIIRLTALSVLVSVCYLCFVQRFNEERYLTPYLPLLIAFLSISLNEILPAKK